jgi:hypothetical protein
MGGFLKEQFSKYDIRTITYDGQTYVIDGAQTAPTINEMSNVLRRKKRYLRWSVFTIKKRNDI